MSTEGNELWNIIGEAYGDDFRAGATRRAVNAIVAAGYRKAEDAIKEAEESAEYDYYENGISQP